MSEIGLAQQRLFDNDASSAAQRLPSTATFYPSEISQPGSFPTMQQYQYQMFDGTGPNGFAYNVAPQEAPYEATQLLAPAQLPAYDYSTPAASNHVGSPFEGLEISAPNHLPANLTVNVVKKGSQRSKSMQSMTYSPHDTEPLSSMTSPRLNRAKSDNEKSGLISPQHSPASTHDELAMPAVTVEVSTVKKKRGRPKKQSLPADDDEDDELALVQESRPDQDELCEKQRSERPARAEVVILKGDFSGITSSSENAIAVANADDVAHFPSVAANQKETSGTPETGNTNAREPKKKKVRRSKTASEVIPKTRPSDIDSEVVWVDPRPYRVDEGHSESNRKPDVKFTLLDPKSAEAPHPDPATSTEEQPQPIKVDEPPAPKKRGRKRKKTDQTADTSAPEEAKPQADILADVQASASNIPPAEHAEPSADTKANQNSEMSENKVPAGADSSTTCKDQSEPLPKTPQKLDDSMTSTSTRKGLGKHSPISSTGKVPYRVGLSRRARIAPLLKIVRK